jgi:CTP:molybdopterin cytidylyltransferase MocA
MSPEATSEAVGLVLAAGSGTRYGQPKATVRDSDGRSWLLGAADALSGGGCARVTVVLGAAAEEVRGLLEGTVIQAVTAEDWADGLSASLRCGLIAMAAEPPEVDRVVVTLVDLPDVSAPVVARLLEQGGGARALLRATYDGRPGHPVVLGREHWPAVLASLSGDRGAGPYLERHSAVGIACSDLAHGRDVDRP